MTAPGWLRSTGAAVAIAASSLPIVLSVPQVMSAHDSLNREMHHSAPVVSGAAGQSASVIDLSQDPAVPFADAAYVRYQ